MASASSSFGPGERGRCDDTDTVPRLVDGLFRRAYGELVARLVRALGPNHFDLAEDVVQEALVRALRTWAFDGVPANPRAWLARVARNAALDRLRHGALAAIDGEGLELVDAAITRDAEVTEIEDDTLRLVFTCCHPRLEFDDRVALTLKTACGLSVPEIARAFLAKDATIAQRLVRAKRRIEEERIEFEVPGEREMRARLDAVLEVLYLVFNEGYAAHGGDALVRIDLTQDALRLVTELARHPATRSPRVDALAALFAFLAARSPARIDAHGALVTLARQERASWDRDLLARAWTHFDRSIEGGERSAYHVEAAIASLHAIAPSYAATDWRAIRAQYDALATLRASPLVALNRAVAVAKCDGFAAGLASLERECAGELATYHLMHATRALLLWSLGRHDDAAKCFRRALELACSTPERALLETRLSRCVAGERADEL